jgi:hypothetical protein
MRAMALPPEMQCWVLRPGTRAVTVTVGDRYTPAPHFWWHYEMRRPPLDTGSSACRIWGQEARASTPHREQPWH